MNEFTFVILAYSRPARLQQVIASIWEFVENPRILVYVDKAKVDSPIDQIASQAKVISECEVSVKSGLIEEFRISESNQGTKASYFASFTWGFTKSDNVVLLEDDMVLIGDPSRFIHRCIKAFESDKTLGMAVLFANFDHGPFESSMQITNWPIMWGILLTARSYSRISNFLLNYGENDVSEVVSKFTKNQLNGKVQSIFRRRFERTWEFKYSRALESRTAWDTQWQFALWGLELRTLVPSHSFLSDLGIDEFSVSTDRDMMEPKKCKSVIHHSIESYFYCRACEIFREVQNFALPVPLRKNRMLNALLLRGLL